jgi:apolipoprotein N-acyltransferase
VDAAGVPLLTGFADLRWYDDSAAPPSARSVPGSTIRYDTYNSTLLLAPGSREEQVYHKSRLTPLSERIPYLDLLPFLQDALRWGVGISSWGLGNDTTVFTLPARARSARIWTMICYETLYPSFVAGFVGRGANALAVVTNDGWFGNSSGPYQLEQYAALRAIETRRAIARCANNGISCFIDPYGRISSETAFGTRTVIRGRLPLRTDRTLYVRWGDWFAKGCVIAALLLCLWSEVSVRRKKLM